MPSPARQPLTFPKWSRGGLAGHNVEDPGLAERFNNQHSLAIGAKGSSGQLAVARPHLNQLGSLPQHRAEAQAMGFLAVCRAAVQLQGRGERGQRVEKITCFHRARPVSHFRADLTLPAFAHEIPLAIELKEDGRQSDQDDSRNTGDLFKLGDAFFE